MGDFRRGRAGQSIAFREGPAPAANEGNRPLRDQRPPLILGVVAPSGVRVAGRLVLVLAGFVAVGWVFAFFRDRLWLQEVDARLRADSFWQAILIGALVVALLVLTDVCLGFVERKSGGSQRTVRSLGVLAIGLLLTAAVGATTVRAVYEPPSTTLKDGRTQLEAVLDRLVVAAGTEPPDLAGAIAGLPRHGRTDCVIGARRAGEFLGWHYTTTSAFPAASVTVIRPARGEIPALADFNAETRARVGRMAAVLEGEGFTVLDDSSPGRISLSATRPAPEADSLPRRSYDIDLSFRLGKSDDGHTFPASVAVRALSPCLW
jgi:hypothetical protein